jgi:membrane protein
MSHDIVAAIITALATLLSPVLGEYLRGRKLKGDDGRKNIPMNESNIQGDGNSVTQIVDQSRTYHTHNVGVVKSGESDEDVFSYLVVFLFAALLILVGVGLYGHAILIGVATAGTLFTISLLVFCVARKSRVNNWLLAVRALSVGLIWVAVYRIESSVSFTYFADVVDDGSIGQKVGAAFRNSYAGASVFVMLVLMVVSVLCLMFSGWELIKETRDGVVEVRGVGGSEAVWLLSGAVTLLVLCIGSGYFDSWMMHMNSRG